ncbi:MAG: stage II sporulation protein R [Firmicutes bacterium]|nr:stage II sporulation protein R [Bacillota bacterium]
MRFFCPYQKQLRLRVIAHSDEKPDQLAKLRVRDGVLPLAARRPLDLDAIQAAAREVEPSARVRFGCFTFGGYASPAVEITLGAGLGHNWWGILYPDAMDTETPAQFESWFLNLLRKWGWIG